MTQLAYRGSTNIRPHR